MCVSLSLSLSLSVRVCDIDDLDIFTYLSNISQKL